MGQYFKAVSLDKREVVCPWCLEGGAKLWEWCANRYGAVFALLLRKSSGTGGGDYSGPPSYTVHSSDGAIAIAHALHTAIEAEGKPSAIPSTSVVGRWAEDRVCLIGDYDESNLWEELDSFTNITQALVEEWNLFVEDRNLELDFRHCGCGSPLLDIPTYHE